MRFSILVGVLPCISHVFASTVPQAAAVLETQLDVIETLTGTIDGIVSSITNQTAGQSFGVSVFPHYNTRNVIMILTFYNCVVPWPKFANLVGLVIWRIGFVAHRSLSG